MTKRTKTKAAQAASRVLKAGSHIKILAECLDAILCVSFEMTDSSHRKRRDIRKKIYQFVDDAETAAASALSQVEGK